MKITFGRFFRITPATIMRCGPTFRLARTHPTHARSSGLETSLRSRSLADYTIDTHESEFSEATAGAIARRPPPKPRGGPSALAGERSEPIWLGVRDHTHALFALKVQRKLSNGVAGLAAAGSSLDRQKSRQFLPSQRRRLMTNVCASTSAKSRPELRIPTAAAQTRVVSGGEVWPIQRELSRHLKYMARARISEIAVGTLITE